ncbi:hypothetical protein AJ80_09214 [Polytolypa hystricis UAMH7299]|uniref:Uncharacterized protein n=1 Tax=Polytolypa hystricis (strain UAMH7299) TaxID=1447883 RepID=A0A2B7WUH9_POLH7|nr:hypothetical protein AJ80_09214 [Polytolypa hystricis UAMH7299]
MKKLTSAHAKSDSQKVTNPTKVVDDEVQHDPCPQSASETTLISYPAHRDMDVYVLGFSQRLRPGVWLSRGTIFFSDAWDPNPCTIGMHRGIHPRPITMRSSFWCKVHARRGEETF